ncbi:MAG: hypothetical protein HQ500_02975 [Flavobacteriales bacterium]|nr:hypothetical protein [Flavobacteriales bacterium]
MELRLIGLAFAVLLSACSNGSADQNAQRADVGSTHEQRTPAISEQELGHPVRYKVREGHISYIYKGLQEGTEEVYFTDYGMVEIKFTKTVRTNPFQEGENKDEQIDLTTLMRDSAIYVVDNLTLNARRLDNALLYESALQSPDLDLDAVAEEVYRSRGGIIVDTQNIAGMPAVKWVIKQANSTEWRWKGIMLKTMVELPRALVQVEAVKIDTTSPLPEGIFDLPKEVNVQEGTSMKKWMEELSKPIERKKFFDLTDPSKHYDKQGNVIPKDSLGVE